MPANDSHLNRAGPYAVGDEIYGDPELTVDRMELRTDGHGPTGFYDVIYVYIEGRDTPFKAMPAHLCDAWEYSE